MQHLMSSKRFLVAQTLGLILSIAFAVFGQTPKPDEASELKAQQIKQLQDAQRAEANAKSAEALVLLQQGTNESVQTALLKFAEARRLYSELDDKQNEGSTLNQLGYIYEELGEKQKALEYYNQALPLFKAIGDKNGEATTLNDIGVVYSNLGESQKPLDYYNQALMLIKAVSYKRLEAATLSNIGVVYLRIGESQKALDYFTQALPLIKAVGDRSEEANILNNIGGVYNDLGEKRKALDYYNQALPLFKAIGDRNGEGSTLSNIGRVYNDLGEKQKALEYFNQALPLRKTVGDKNGEAIVLHNAGAVYADLGENQKSLEYLNQALSLRKAIGDKNGEAYTFNYMGFVYSNLGENQKSLEYYNQALSLRKATGDRRGEASTLNNIGGVYSNLGEMQKAFEYYNQALSLRKAIGDKDGEATILHNIAAVYAELGENQKALEYFNQVLPFYKAVGNKNGEGSTLSNIGKVYSNLGEKRKALEYFNQALPLRKAIGDRGGEANTLNNIGGVYRDLGEKQKALEYHNQALSLIRAVDDKHGEARILGNMMFVWESLNNRRLAILYGKQSVNVFQNLRADIKGLDKELQQSFLGTAEDTYRDLAELLIKENRIPEAEQVLRMLKEEEYFEFVRRDGRIVASLDERINLNPAEKQSAEQYEIISLEISRIYHEIEELEKEKSNASAGQNDNISDRQTELNKNLEVSLSKLKSFLVELSKDFAKKDADSKNVEESSQAIVKEWNDPQTAVISTIVGVNNLSLIVTTTEFQRGYVIPVSAEKLNTLVGNFRTAIIERSNPQPAGQELYNVLIKPIEKDLESVKARTLVWSLDKFLRYAPVSALWDKDKGYVVQNYASVVLALASRQNLAFRPENKKQWQALGVGVSKETEGFAPLSYVRKELKAIVRDSSAQPKKEEVGIITGRRLLDEQFNYDNFLKSLKSYRFTHTATHFKFISGTKAEGLNSFLLMGNGEKLTLAQVQNSDNIFAGIELLTLSACDTGYGGKTADGREIEGFGVLAQKKGARAIMATLWNVNDESTRDLMIEFYGDYQKPNFTKAEALRQAQLALLQESDKAANGKTMKPVNASPKQFAHPYYWSPFILIGNWQ